MVQRQPARPRVEKQHPLHLHGVLEVAVPMQKYRGACLPQEGGQLGIGEKTFSDVPGHLGASGVPLGEQLIQLAGSRRFLSPVIQGHRRFVL